MDVIVCLKAIPDLKQIRIKRETREPVLEGVPLVWGDMDKNALEEAVRLRERHGGKVTALALGGTRLKEAMIEALAMGADEGVLLVDPLFQTYDTAGVAKALAAAALRLPRFDLILVAEGSSDSYSGQVGPRVAEMLGLPQVTYAREVSVEGSVLRAVRSLEGAFEVVECTLPAVVSVTQEINTPRLPALTAILRASRKPQQAWSAADLGLADTPVLVERLRNQAPQQERRNILFEGDDAEDRLVAALLKDGAVSS